MVRPARPQCFARIRRSWTHRGERCRRRLPGDPRRL